MAIKNTMTAFGAAAVLSATLLGAAGGCNMVRNVPPTPAQRADQLATGVSLASGANALPKVGKISFTLVVREGDEIKVARSHVWDLRTRTDTVTAGEKTTTVDLRNQKADDEADAAAFKAWTDDTRWLTAPLTLFDVGVTRQYAGVREVAGKGYEVLKVTTAGSGPTPGDRYDLYIDPYTSLIAYCDHTSDADTTTRATWDAYRHKSGLKLSTHHALGNQTVTIEGLVVQAE